MTECQTDIVKPVEQTVFAEGLNLKGQLFSIWLDDNLSFKINRQLIAALGQPGNDESVLRAMVTMGRNMGIRVVGVGVETELQLEVLRAAGCDEAQGFYLGSPMPGDEFIATLLRNPALQTPAYSASLPR